MDKSLENLKKYVEYVKMLEIEKYTLRKTMQGLDDEMSRLGIPRTVRKRKNEYDENDCFDTSSGCGCIVGVLMMVMLGLGLMLVSTTHHKEIVYLGWFVLIIWVGLLTLIIRRGYLAQKNFENEEREIDREYEADLQAEERRLESEEKLRKEQEKAKASIQETYDATCRTLEAVYAKNVIYDEYRHNLVAICMFSKYLQSGMCNSLQGSDGAYSRYETDIRLGLILYRLEQIVDNLEAIRQNQYTLYVALKQANEQQALMIQNLEQISANQQEQSRQLEYVEYNTQVLKQNSNVERWISTWDRL